MHDEFEKGIENAINPWRTLLPAQKVVLELPHYSSFADTNREKLVYTDLTDALLGDAPCIDSPSVQLVQGPTGWVGVLDLISIGSSDRTPSFYLGAHGSAIWTICLR